MSPGRRRHRRPWRRRHRRRTPPAPRSPTGRPRRRARCVGSSRSFVAPHEIRKFDLQ
jgi:hypothetical protein